MFQNLTKTICLFITVAVITKASAQTTTIDYLTSNLSSSACNVFSPSVYVSNILHNSHAGGVSFNSTNGLKLTTASSGTLAGTAFYLNYNFVPGFKYNVSITAKGNTAAMNLRACVLTNLSQYATNGSTLCVPDPNISSYSVSSIGSLNTGVTLASNTYNMNQFAVTGINSYSTLLVWANLGNPSLTNDFLYISKIEIVKTPDDIFTISPTSVDVQCSTTATTKTFTITNVNNSQNVTYEWNLGSTNTGWLYNNTQAPQYITTTSPSLTLSTNCGSFPNISVIPKVNGVNTPTLTSNVNVIEPSLQITGPSIFCTSGQYIINNLPCNSTISGWTITPSSAASISGTNPITVTKTTGGAFQLRATVSACGRNFDYIMNSHAGDQNVTIASTQLNCDEVQFNVYGTNSTSYSWNSYGGLLLNGTSTSASTSVPYISASGMGTVQVTTTKVCGSTVNPYADFFPYQKQIQSSSYFPLFLGDPLSVYIDPIDNATNYRWYLNGNLVAQGNNQTSYCTCSEGGSEYLLCSDQNIISLEVDTDCGSFEAGELEFERSCTYGRPSSEIRIYPNPATDLITIKWDNINTDSKIKFIKDIKIIDKQGRILKAAKFGKSETSVNLNVSNLSSGSYILVVSDGVNVTTFKLIKVK